MTNASATKKTLADLLAVMAQLRTPVTGCPWDLEQTFETIAPYTVEEAYEVADAIARGDLADLKDELGDLLLQVVYHARLAEEQDAFDFTDVADAIVAKMVRRHPHVFAPDGTPLAPEARARSATLAKDWWERIKAEEKIAKVMDRARLAGTASGGAVRPAAPSLLADVPVGLPGLTRAIKLQGKAAKVGFDWPSLGPVFEKLREEIGELEEVALPCDPRSAQTQEPSPPGPPARDVESGGDLSKVAEEFGDLMFVMANVARHLGIDPEAALRQANDKFCRRFGYIEARLGEGGRTPAQSSLTEMDRLWDEAKARERER